MPTRAEFISWWASQHLGLRHFTASEFLVKTDRPGNSIPPRELWPNIIPTAKVLDELRRRLGLAVTIHSCYRDPSYNASVGGVKSSQHLKFKACDITCAGKTPAQVHRVLRDMRAGGWFTGGLGLYRTFTHVDTRPYNADWKGKGV